MENIALDDNLEGKPEQRPVFVTVLCILTFVGVGLGILSNLWWLAFLDAFDGLRQRSDSTVMLSAFGNIAGNGLCLWGALVMWNLRQYGYFIYIAGQIIPIIVHFIFWGRFLNTPFGMFNFLMFTALVPLAFIIMYGTNLKYLK